MRFFLVAVLVLCGFFRSNGRQVSDTLYFNSGTINLLQNGPTFPYKALNPSPNYVRQAHRIDLEPNDTLNLFLVNNDSVEHSFTIRNTSFALPILSPGSIDSLVISFSNPGVYLYEDTLNFNNVLGVSGMLRIWPRFKDSFFWNLKEHESSLNAKLIGQQPFDADTFAPDGFTINELSHPALQNDSSAVVVGNVGDTILIFISNAGLMDHSIHYHGYHIEIIYSSESNPQLNWIKDSVPIKAGECQVHRLVPNQPGTFPVHDHNLVATTLGGNSPGGMLVFISIDP